MYGRFMEELFPMLKFSPLSSSMLNDERYRKILNDTDQSRTVILTAGMFWRHIHFQIVENSTVASIYYLL